MVKIILLVRLYAVYPLRYVVSGVLRELHNLFNSLFTKENIESDTYLQTHMNSAMVIPIIAVIYVSYSLCWSCCAHVAVSSCAEHHR